MSVLASEIGQKTRIILILRNVHPEQQGGIYPNWMSRPMGYAYRYKTK